MHNAKLKGIVCNFLAHLVLFKTNVDRNIFIYHNTNVFRILKREY